MWTAAQRPPMLSFPRPPQEEACPEVTLVLFLWLVRQELLIGELVRWSNSYSNFVSSFLSVRPLGFFGVTGMHVRLEASQEWMEIWRKREHSSQHQGMRENCELELQGRCEGGCGGHAVLPCWRAFITCFRTCRTCQFPPVYFRRLAE